MRQIVRRLDLLAVYENDSLMGIELTKTRENLTAYVSTPKNEGKLMPGGRKAIHTVGTVAFIVLAPC